MTNTPAFWSERAAVADPVEAVLWTRLGQLERFRAVITALAPRDGEILLDFGCGLGALAQFASPDAYFGYDWSTAMVERARLEHPEHRFTDERPTGWFDLIACVGTFNLADPDEIYETLDDLWEKTGRALAVCLYYGNDPGTRSYDPGDLITYARSHSRWRLERHRDNDLLLVLSRS